MNQDKLWEPARRIELNYTKALRKVARRMNFLIRGVSDPDKIISILADYVKTKAFSNTMVTKVTIVQLNFNQSEGVLSPESGGIYSITFCCGPVFLQQ